MFRLVFKSSLSQQLSVDHTMPLVNILTTRTYTDCKLDYHLGLDIILIVYKLSIYEIQFNTPNINYNIFPNINVFKSLSGPHLVSLKPSPHCQCPRPHFPGPYTL